MKEKTKRLLSLLLTAVMLVTAQGFTVLANTVSENDAQNIYAEEETGENPAQNVEDEAGENIEMGEEDAAIEAQTQAAAPANPVHHCTKKNDGTDYTDFSYIYFGSYPQSEVRDSATITAIDSAIATSGTTADAGIDVWVNGTKYRRIDRGDINGYADWDNEYRYFKWERIKWRVLDNSDGGFLFVMADSALDCKRYNDEWVDITWENSTIRSWLKDSFYQTAFSSSEQSAIELWHVVNEDNPYYGTEGGNTTTDPVYLLSIGEMTNEEYGFCSDDTTESLSRRLQTSEYAYARGAWRSTWSGYEGKCWWWLRSPGYDSRDAVYVYCGGDMYSGECSVYDNYGGVVPALHINLSSNLWSMADGGSDDGIATGIRLTASQVTSRTGTVPQGASFTVTDSNPANPTVCFDGVSNENAAAVTIPKTITYKGVEYKVTTVSPTAFSTKKDNASFTVTDNRVESLTVEYKAPSNTKKTKVTVPETTTYKGIKFKVTSIAAKSFKNNKKVKQVSVAGSVTKIGDSSFEGCISLKSVTLGKGAASIGKNAFKNCKKLTKITIKSTKLKTVGKNALKGINAKCKIKVPVKQLKKYQKLFKKKGQKNSVKLVK